MGQFNLNLSTRPFKPYRAVNLLLLVGLLGLVYVSVLQFYNYQQNASQAGTIRPNHLKAKAEADELKKQVELKNARLLSENAPAKMSDVQIYNELIKKRKFSWTRVFANLEQIMPENVYLLSLSPFLDDKGNIGLNIVFRGKSFEDGAGFVKTLENSDIFSEVAVAVEDLKEPSREVEFALSTYYFPERGAE